MKRITQLLIQPFLVELLVYGLLVCGYFFLVLDVLGDRLNLLFLEDRKLYAGLSLGLIVGQGLLLEILTRLLLAWVTPRGED